MSVVGGTVVTSKGVRSVVGDVSAGRDRAFNNVTESIESTSASFDGFEIEGSNALNDALAALDALSGFSLGPAPNMQLDIPAYLNSYTIQVPADKSTQIFRPDRSFEISNFEGSKNGTDYAEERGGESGIKVPEMTELTIGTDVLNSIDDAVGSETDEQGDIVVDGDRPDLFANEPPVRPPNIQFNFSPPIQPNEGADLTVPELPSLPDTTDITVTFADSPTLLEYSVVTLPALEVPDYVDGDYGLEQVQAEAEGLLADLENVSTSLGIQTDQILAKLAGGVSTANPYETYSDIALNELGNLQSVLTDKDFDIPKWAEVDKRSAAQFPGLFEGNSPSFCTAADEIFEADADLLGAEAPYFTNILNAQADFVNAAAGPAAQAVYSSEVDAPLDRLQGFDVSAFAANYRRLSALASTIYSARVDAYKTEAKQYAQSFLAASARLASLREQSKTQSQRIASTRQAARSFAVEVDAELVRVDLFSLQVRKLRAEVDRYKAQMDAFKAQSEATRGAFGLYQAEVDKYAADLVDYRSTFDAYDAGLGAVTAQNRKLAAMVNAKTAEMSITEAVAEKAIARMETQSERIQLKANAEQSGFEESKYENYSQNRRTQVAGEIKSQQVESWGTTVHSNRVPTDIYNKGLVANIQQVARYYETMSNLAFRTATLNADTQNAYNRPLIDAQTSASRTGASLAQGAYSAISLRASINGVRAVSGGYSESATQNKSIADFLNYRETF